MDTFKGKENKTLEELCSQNKYKIVIVPHSLKYKSESLDISVNRSAKSFIQNLQWAGLKSGTYSPVGYLEFGIKDLI